ncbi:hypothetical protein [Nocardia sp. NPDC051750]|uniref:hypothetical protein n=1 Tax=Nocardia sp. NPDC051750 TaxID=3364325 RepID=UPI0037A4FCC8
MTSIEGIGDLPDRIGFRKTADPDGVVRELPVAPHAVNLTGGLLATLVDIAAGTAALEQRPPGGGVMTAGVPPWSPSTSV